MISQKKAGKSVVGIVAAMVIMAGLGISLMNLACSSSGGGNSDFTITIAPDYPSTATTGDRVIANMGVWFSPAADSNFSAVDPASLTVILTGPSGDVLQDTYLNSDKNFAIVKPRQILSVGTYTIAVAAVNKDNTGVIKSAAQEFTVVMPPASPTITPCTGAAIPPATGTCSGNSLVVTSVDQPAALGDLIKGQLPTLLTSIIDRTYGTDPKTGYFQIIGGQGNGAVGGCGDGHIQTKVGAVTVSLGGNFYGPYIRIGGELKFPLAGIGDLVVNDFGLSGELDSQGGITNGVLVAVVNCTDLCNAISLFCGLRSSFCDVNDNLVLVGRFNANACNIPRDYGPVEGSWNSITSTTFTGSTIASSPAPTLGVTFTLGGGFTIGSFIPNISLIKVETDNFLSRAVRGSSLPNPLTAASNAAVPITGATFTPTGSNWIGSSSYKALSTINLIKITETTFRTQ